MLGEPQSAQWFRDQGITKRAVPLGVVFNVKYERFEISKYKIRLCLRGTKYSMGEIDFEDKFSASPSLVTIRLMLAIMVKTGMKLRCWDVIAAYLNGILPECERLPVILPKGLKVFADDGEELHRARYRALYGHPISDKI